MGQLVFQATLGGQVNLVGPNTASTFNINVPATSGNMVTTGDTGTVTTTMLASTTGSGAVVLATSPTLVTPALGTPSALVGTNITGTAAGLSIGGNAATATTATNVSGGTSSVTSETVSGNLTLSGGTANGVAYLNGSKVVTTGSALTFDGTGNFFLTAASGGSEIRSYSSAASTTAALSMRNPDRYWQMSSQPGGAFLLYDTTGSQSTWSVTPGASGYSVWYQNGSEQMRLTSTGLGIGTSSPAYKLDVSGVIRGTSDALINGITVGRGAGAIASNTAVGTSALATNTTGANNTAVGYQSLNSNTTGSNSQAFGYLAGYFNTTGLIHAIGRQALYNNTTGSNNDALGYQTLYSTTTGGGNVAIGDFAMYTNSTGSYNTALGNSALYSNTTISNNTAVGFQAGYANTTGQIDAFGKAALYSNTTGSSNTAVGYNALLSNTTGASNVAIGTYGNDNAPLQSNTTGSSNIAIGVAALTFNTTASGNTAVGYQAAKSNTTGASNSAFGGGALTSNTTGANNTAVGYQAGNANTTGAQNTYVGYQAGFYTTTGTWNTLIGVQAGTNLSTGSKNTLVGASGTSGAGYLITTGSANTVLGGFSGNQGGLDIRTSSNYIVLSDGDGNLGAYWTNGGGWYQKNNSTLWSITSDARIKKNVVSLESGLSVIKALRPVEFDYIENNKHDIGFIAQEYKQILPEQVNQKDDGMLSLTPNLVPYLVKAVQELSAQMAQLQSQLKG